MIKPMFIASKPFGPDDPDRWRSYVEWSGLSQLTAVVSLDGILCPNVIVEINADDWNHNVQEDFLISFFWDLDYLLERVRAIPKAQILAALREPGTDCVTEFDDGRFIFEGYDLMNRQAGNSALTNCGGFPKAFDNRELSEVGLIRSYDRAVEVQASLRRNYPECFDADCLVWGLWRMLDRR